MSRSSRRRSRFFTSLAAEQLESRQLLAVNFLGDLNKDPLHSDPRGLVNAGGVAFFIADATAGGKGLYKSNGSAGGTVRLATIDGFFNGDPQLVPVGNKIFFANDGGDGVELWKSDGTVAGTSQVKDLWPGGLYSYDPYYPYDDPYDSFPADLTNVSGTLYFTAEDDFGGRQLWKSDGTAAGTQKVKDVAPSQRAYFPQELTNVNGTLFFTAEDGAGRELWKSNGTAAGTVRVKDITAGVTGSQLEHLSNAGGKLYFVNAKDQLWKSDGTAAGTQLLKDMGAATNTHLRALTAVGNKLFFAFEAGGEGTLWKSEGTAATTVKIGAASYGAIEEVVAVGNTLYFAGAGEIDTNIELWKSDGTGPGTFRVKDIFAGDTGSVPSSLTNVGGVLYFAAADATAGRELWKSNGTSAGTVRVKDMFSGTKGSDPANLLSINGKVFFSATDPTVGRELRKSDGTAAGTGLIKNIAEGTVGSGPLPLANVNGVMYFTAHTAGGFGLWKSGGTPGSTVLVKQMPENSYIDSFEGKSVAVGGTLFFVANDSAGDELWMSNGTAAGTKRVADLFVGSSNGYPNSSDPDQLTNVNGTLFFTAETSTGRELWKSNGTAAGTVLVKDIFIGTSPYSGPNSSEPRDLVNVSGTLYFSAATAAGRELWKTNGSAAGTVQVKDISPGSSGSYPDNLVNVGGVLFFTAENEASGEELWKSNGTVAGTVPVKDIRSGTASSYPAGLVNVGGVLFFTAHDNIAGKELWRSNGTAAGTVRIKDIRPGASDSFIADDDMAVINNTLFFSADDGSSGRELWKSDGTTGGTVRVKDLRPGSAGGALYQLTNVKGALHFLTRNAASEYELWRSGGTSASTWKINLGTGRSAPYHLIGAGGRLFFSAVDKFGYELYALTVNAPPAMTLSGTTSYAFNNAAVILAPNATVSDADSADFSGGQLRVRIDAGSQASNRLSIAGSFVVGTDRSVKLDGVTIGTRTSDGVGTNGLVINFNANATKARVQQLVRSIAFKTATASPGQRKVIFTVSDGDGGISAEQTKTVNVT